MPKLIVQDAGRSLLLDLRPEESLTVGRASECDVRIGAPRASRRHLEIAASPEGHVLRDLGSTNGTTLNGAPFAEPMKLREGDVIDAAGCRLVYRRHP